MEASLHPHMGTMIESGAETQRVIEGSQIGLCVDTGHLAAAGADPGAIVAANPARVRHVHLKDVDSALAGRVVGRLAAPSPTPSAKGCSCRSAPATWTSPGSWTSLEGAGYQGWYVLEQDVMLPGEPDGEGPVADVRQCLDYLTGGNR